MAYDFIHFIIHLSPAEAPVLLTQRRVVSVYEGSDVQLTCNLRANYLPVSEITWFNNQGVDVRETTKYNLLQTSAWANLTVRDTDEIQDSGEYRCTTSNAVGGTEINVTLVIKSKKLFSFFLSFRASQYFVILENAFNSCLVGCYMIRLIPFSCL